MTEGASATNTALLVQVLDQLGAVRQEIGSMRNQLDHGARRFDAIGVQIDGLEKQQVATAAAVTPLASSMAIVEPKVKTMEKFLGTKLAPIVAVSSTLIAIALWLIAITAGAAFTWAKGAINSHLHWS